MLHRHNHKSQGGKWGVPAGKVDKDDKSRELALIREIFEETGLKLKEKNINFHKTFYVVYPDKKYLYHYYKTELDNIFGVIIEKNEHQNFIWATLEEALNLPLVMDEDYCLKDYYGIK